MLIITVKTGREKVKIGDALLCVLNYKANEVTIGIEADKSIKINRIQEEYLCGRKREAEKQLRKAKKRNGTQLDCTQAMLKRLKKPLDQSKNGLMSQSKRLNSCVVCFNDICECRV